MTNPVTDSIYGYYKVGEQLYLNKTEALYNSSKNKKPVEWNFHTETFSNIDWTQRPSGTLYELYKERAQQIRDKYDYVIVSFSGGMDSWTVLDSFLSNGIHVDEVITRWARAERKYVKLSKDTSQQNMGSEYEFAVLPVIKHIQKNYPNTRVVMDDFSNSLEKEEFTDDIFSQFYNYQNIASFSKYSNRSEGELDAIKHNKKIAFVTGSEKTHVAAKDGNFYAFFTDQSNGADLYGREVEFFYWSPEFPLITVLQAHCLKDHIIEKYKLDNTKIPEHKTFKYTYQEVCYPKYNIDTFQVGKNFGTLIWPSDHWIKEYNPKFYESWRWYTDQYYNGISEDYLRTDYTGSVIGLNQYISNFYLVESNTGLPDFKC